MRMLRHQLDHGLQPRHDAPRSVRGVLSNIGKYRFEFSGSAA